MEETKNYFDKKIPNLFVKNVQQQQTLILPHTHTIALHDTHLKEEII